ncbi:CaiB/BaiF CoA-transferase family protein [Salinicola sp. MIT1003]|uniref:CaiB/BaiF CoA transferase family protein n=1 Tax=Salinicola sp. MIT1003 TaxID=1882734 RepID=UPI0008DDF465|nr:CaiB/BaiF CoA-transferase family protein [Salinicola sp. MIT1003]OHZ00419.1 acyl-CoA transferase [Salinicola sp. MIT1003]
MDKPLEGLLVLDFSQFLAGPSAALRMADLGATVIKIERPGVGELARQLYISDLELDGDSTLFHTINRNKQSYGADLKNPEDMVRVKKLIARADVMIQNFRPGVIERLGLGYETARALNPGIVYGTVSGYGKAGPWSHLAGQDLLAQSRSGLTWLSGNADQGPIAFGLSIADLAAGAHLVQGILACLVRRGIRKVGGLVEVSLMESVLDLQFELLTTYLNDGGKLPARGTRNSANAYLGAPYGIYETQDGYLALAMGSLAKLAEALEYPALNAFGEREQLFTQRDEIKRLIAEHLKQRPTDFWTAKLEAVDYWCAPVWDWNDLLNSDGFQALEFVQEVQRDNGARLRTTRCPISIDGERYYCGRGAPKPGEHTIGIDESFGLNA